VYSFRGYFGYEAALFFTLLTEIVFSIISLISKYFPSRVENLRRMMEKLEESVFQFKVNKI
jgi:hypothetical protein